MILINHLIIITNNIILSIQKNKLNENIFLFLFFNQVSVVTYFVFYFQSFNVLQTQKCFYWSSSIRILSCLYKTILKKNKKICNLCDRLKKRIVRILSSFLLILFFVHWTRSLFFEFDDINTRTRTESVLY
jgi:hypothetical protein